MIGRCKKLLHAAMCLVGLHRWRRHWVLPAFQCERCLKLGRVAWKEHETKYYKVLLLNFNEPDAEGECFEAPVDLSRLKPAVRVNFANAPVGRVLNATQDGEQLTAVLELQNDPRDCVPVIGFAAPTGISDQEGRPKTGVWKRVSVTEVSLTERSRAILPHSFYMNEIE